MSDLTLNDCLEILRECRHALFEAEPDSVEASQAQRKMNWVLFHKFKVKESWAVHPQGHDPDDDPDGPDAGDFKGRTRWFDTFAEAKLWPEVQRLGWYPECWDFTRRVCWIDPETELTIEIEDTLIDPFEVGAKI